MKDKKIVLTKEQFKEKYLSMSTRALAEELGLCRMTVYKMAKKLGIGNKKDGRKCNTNVEII